MINCTSLNVKLKTSKNLLLFTFLTCANAQIPLNTDRSDIRGMLTMEGQEDVGASQLTPISLETSVDEAEYSVGPGDEFQIYAGRNYTLKINPENYLNFPGLPPINLDGATLLEAKLRIKAALKKDFNIDLVYVSIRQLKNIKVAVLGEVNIPGIFTVPGNYRLSELITKAGGFSKTAQVPFVKILRKDGSKVEVDLGEYFRSGSLLNNPNLKQGERVFVPQINMSQPKIEILMGNISNYYQLRVPRPLGEIITELSGFSKAFDLRAARLNSGRVLVGQKLLEYTPRDGDIIEFLGPELKVYVEGEVGKPFIYNYIPGQSVRDYIAEAGLSSSTQLQGKVKIVRVDGMAEDLDISSSHINPGDHIYVRRSAYASFKEGLFVASSVAAVLFSTVYLIQALNSLKSL